MFPVKKVPITNASALTEVILLGLTDCPELQPLLFMLFLVIYLVTILGNLGLMVLIQLDPRLHTPMYLFLTNLAFVDLCYTSNATPQMLTNLFSEKKTISFAGCFAQCYIFIALLLTELYMLAAMAYDSSVAICDPLRYSVKMSRRVCLCLATFLYAYAFSNGCSRPSWPSVWPSVDPMSSTISTVLTHHSLTFLLWYLCQRACHAHISWFQPFQLPHHHPSVLCLHYCHRLQDQISRGKAQGILHLWFPHDGCNPLLWHPLLHVCKTTHRADCWRIQNHSCLLHLCKSTALSVDLQPVEQRCKTGLEESAQ